MKALPSPPSNWLRSRCSGLWLGSVAEDEAIRISGPVLAVALARGDNHGGWSRVVYPNRPWVKKGFHPGSPGPVQDRRGIRRYCTMHQANGKILGDGTTVGDPI